MYHEGLLSSLFLLYMFLLGQNLVFDGHFFTILAFALSFFVVGGVVGLACCGLFLFVSSRTMFSGDLVSL